MVFGPPRDVWKWVKAHNPGSPFKKRHLTFMTCHYMYIMGLTIMASILIYPAGGIAYIDALLFASGAATQSGLNTVDVNKLYTEQQVVIYLIAMIANPIFINTFVVFVRLYWFEKRFQHTVREARNSRQTRTRSRTNSQAIHEKDPGKEERGVNGRSIVVLHGRGQSLGPGMGTPATYRLDNNGDVGSAPDSLDSRKETPGSSNEDLEVPQVTSPTPNTPFTREITFADEVNRVTSATSTDQRIPRQMSAEQQIAFLENQRNPKDKGALRIPGPREFDRGDVPQNLSRDDREDSLRRDSTNSAGFPNNDDIAPDEEDGQLERNDQVHRNITIDETKAVQARQNRRTSPSSRLTFRKTATNRTENTPSFERHGSSGRPRSNTFEGSRSNTSKESHPIPYLSWQPTIGRNSAFVDLTEEQREELGGIEYRSLKTLAVLLVSYFFFFHLLGVVTFTPWIILTDTWGSIVDAAGQSRAWWGIFSAATCFNDLGFALTPDSFISFQLAVLPLLLGTILIIIGNTGFPCMLRLIIWLITKFIPDDSGLWEELKFLLDHPRRCFTLLFPSEATWWLFWILVLLNGIDVVFFIILDLGDSAITSISPAGFRVLDGLFQAASTRTSGTSVVNIADLHPGIQVSYLIMMYISVFPIAISVRRTNVYEEKSLGIYGGRGEEETDEKEPSYVGAHLRRQLSFDLWFVFLGLFIIAIAEGNRLQDPNDTAFSLWACLFEIVSAYGTVGLSLGYTDINASFCAEFGIVAKLVIVAMQIRGRHRGLPYDLDRAILLPSESLHKNEDQDAARRVQRRMSNTAMDSNGNLSRPFTRHGTGMSTGRSEAGNEIKRSLTKASQNSHVHGKLGLGNVLAGLARGSEAVKGHE
ncbi:low affinity potassium transporter [Xylographa opegraphella]|nr:low affinity potassium transporter [Xylographa opegraphella]